MAVKIRLSRIGKKHAPFFRIVAVDSRKKRDGKFLDNMGTYDVLKSKIITFNETLYTDWVSKGAIATDGAKKIFKLYKKNVKNEEKNEKVESSVAVKPKKEVKKVVAKESKPAKKEASVEATTQEKE